MADINVEITEETPINVNITEETPIEIKITDGLSPLFASIFEPDEDGKRITKMYVKDGKLKVKYEGGE